MAKTVMAIENRTWDLVTVAASQEQLSQKVSVLVEEDLGEIYRDSMIFINSSY